MNSYPLGFKNIIKEFLLYLSESQKNLEIQKLKLMKSYNFNNKSGYFKYLDKNCKNYIDISDISSFLSIDKIKHSQAHLKHIMKEYDKNKDNCWNLEEFNSFILPKKNNIKANNISLLLNQKDTFTNTDFISNTYSFDAINIYEKELRNLFQMTIRTINYIAIKVKGIKSTPNNLNQDITANIVYNYILYITKSNKIDINCLNLFLCDNDYHSMMENSQNIIEKYGNANGEISLFNLEQLFKYDTIFITEKDTTYVRTKGYYKTNPIDYSETLYYNVYQRNKKKYEDLGYYSIRGSEYTFK